jgi:hypothetical protein
MRTAARLLDGASAVAFVLGVLAVALPGRAATAAGVVAVAVVAGAPLVRVAWLGGRWARKGDTRFALLAGALLAVVGTGVALAAVA